MTLAPTDVYPLGAGSARPVIDVRAPVEVARGALPGAASLPLLTDEERHLVGLRYKEAGQEAAVALGHELVRASLPARIDAWRAVVEASAGPTAVACWRGGLRSRLAVEFIGRPQAVAVAGGYRALRRHLVATLPAAVAAKRVLVLAGLTGAGKTRLLRRLAADAPPGLQVVDLEGLARHRGSAFGHLTEAQPSQQTFENAVAAEVIVSRAALLLVEDESRHVGRRTLPDALHHAMSRAPLVMLEAGPASRARAIHAEYVAAATLERGREAVAADLLASLAHLRRRLGGAVSDALAERVARLAADGAAWDDPAAHGGWIQELLERHYDPLYRRALRRLARPVMFAGDEAEVLGWLRTEAA